MLQFKFENNKDLRQQRIVRRAFGKYFCSQIEFGLKCIDLAVTVGVSKCAPTEASLFHLLLC